MDIRLIVAAGASAALFGLSLLVMAFPALGVGLGLVIDAVAMTGIPKAGQVAALGGISLAAGVVSALVFGRIRARTAG